MSAFTLDNIRAAAEAKYGSTDIAVDEYTTVRLLNPLRLSKENREALVAIQDRFGDEESDPAEIFRSALRLVADNKVAVEQLIIAVGDDLAVLAQIFETYSSGTSLGEASASVA
jgi:hypothetical protein